MVAHNPCTSMKSVVTFGPHIPRKSPASHHHFPCIHLASLRAITHFARTFAAYPCALTAHHCRISSFHRKLTAHSLSFTAHSPHTAACLPKPPSRRRSRRTGLYNLPRSAAEKPTSASSRPHRKKHCPYGQSTPSNPGGPRLLPAHTPLPTARYL